jgi:hypothetical protein
VESNVRKDHSELVVTGKRSDQGGASVYVLGFIALAFLIVMVMHQLNTQMLVTEKQRVKLILNRAVHAGSLEWDKRLLADGILKLDEAKAREQFKQYLKKGFQLDDVLHPTPSSFLYHPVETLHFSFVQEGPFPRVLEHTITMQDGERVITETVREIIVGPSVFAVIKVSHKGIGLAPDTPYFVAAIEEVRW